MAEPTNLMQQPPQKSMFSSFEKNKKNMNIHVSYSSNLTIKNHTFGVKKLWKLCFVNKRGIAIALYFLDFDATTAFCYLKTGAHNLKFYILL